MQSVHDTGATHHLHSDSHDHYLFAAHGPWRPGKTISSDLPLRSAVKRAMTLQPRFVEALLFQVPATELQ
jgi:hypothetical protein